jgi:hypothetical protein
MARGRKPQGDQPLTAAERQARYRARHARAPVVRYRRLVDRRGTEPVAPQPVHRRVRPLYRKPQDGVARRRTAADASPSVPPPQAGTETALDAR